MCNASLVVMGAISALSAAQQYQQSHKNARVQEQVYEDNAENAQASARNVYTQNAIKAQQIKESNAAQIEETTREGMRQTSTASVAAGESGVSGVSVDQIMRNVGATAVQEVSNIQTNQDWNLAQINQSNLATQTQTEGRINSVTSGSSVDITPYLIQAGSGAANAYSSYLNRQTANKTTTTK